MVGVLVNWCMPFGACTAMLFESNETHGECMGIRRRIRKTLSILGGNEPEANAGVEQQAAPVRPVRTFEAEPEPESPRGDQDPTAYIEEVVKKHPVTLFMKGTPKSPQCGFSASASAMLGTYGVPVHTVDILLDPDVRSAVKAYSSWPTLPQIYVGGEFVGGSDIVSQLHENGDLGELIAKTKS